MTDPTHEQLLDRWHRDSVQKLSVWLPVSQDDLDDAATFPDPYTTSAGVTIWTWEPLDSLIHSLRWIYER